MKTFDIEYTRTITINGTFQLKAKNEDDATEKAEKMIIDGKFGYISTEVKNAVEAIAKGNLTEEAEEITIDTAVEA